MSATLQRILAPSHNLCDDLASSRARICSQLHLCDDRIQATHLVLLIKHIYITYFILKRANSVTTNINNLRRDKGSR